jgi:hypothetical protein
VAVTERAPARAVSAAACTAAIALVVLGLAPAHAERSSNSKATLGGKAKKPAEAKSGTSYKVSAEVGGYGDTDAVYVASPTISLGVGDQLAGWSVSGRYLVDAVSAASVDIVSSASGKWTEYRHVGSLAVDVPVGEAKLSVSGGVSREPDYLSLGGGVTVAFDLLDKNLTPFFGVSYGDDSAGRTGEPKEFWRKMQKFGAQAGATFVVDRSTIAGVTFDAISERGYLGKPYRFVPLFGPGRGAALPAGASPDEVNRARLDERPADAVPEARDRLAVTGRIAHRWDGVTLRLDERLYADTWGLVASTSELRLWLDAGSHVLLGPHVRYHGQRGVKFWQRTYEASAAAEGQRPGPPRYRTGDRELGPLGTLTAGATLRWLLTERGSNPLTFFLQVDGGQTRFFDALYITRRLAVYSAVGLEAEID